MSHDPAASADAEGANEAASARRDSSVGWGTIIGAGLGGAAAGAATFGAALLTPAGNAIVTGLAAVAGALFVHLFTPQRLPAGLAIIASVLGATAAFSWMREKPPPGVAALRGGREPFTVYAQDRWRPRGTAVRMSPLPESRPIGAFSGNALVTVDGWVRTKPPPYPHNLEPFDNEYWIHLADDSGWVAFAGVRADSTRSTRRDSARTAGGRRDAVRMQWCGRVPQRREVRAASEHLASSMRRDVSPAMRRRKAM